MAKSRPSKRRPTGAWDKILLPIAVILGVAGLLAVVYHSNQQQPRATDSGQAQVAQPSKARKDWPKWARDDPAVTIRDLPPRRFRIINDHEHILDEREALRVLKAMDRLGIEKMALMGTSRYTFTLNNRYGFEHFKENNEEILRIAKKWPDRFLAFPTIFPPDPGNLELLQDYVARGAAGLKLYLGHGASTGKEPFHMMPLNDPRMKPIYRWAQEVQLPIQLHVNLTKYWDEFLELMEEFPYLRVCIPHFGLYKNTPKRLTELGRLLDRYPNLYSDVSFGATEFQVQGFQKFDQFPSRYRKFLEKYAHRFMYSADMVVERTKEDAYIDDTLRSYMQVLEMGWYRFFLEPNRLYRGIGLPEDALRKIYEETPRRFHLLDEQGNPPDRSKGWPWPGWEGVASLPGLPPAVPAVQPLPPGGWKAAFADQAAPPGTRPTGP